MFDGIEPHDHIYSAVMPGSGTWVLVAAAAGVYPGYGAGWVAGGAIPVPNPSHPRVPILVYS